jgi:LPXTG-motif cell wall-anchored protein
LGSSWTADSTFGLGDDDASDDGIVRANTPWVAGNGEVEDFVWGFGPTAVSLQTLNVPPSNTYIIWLMIGVLLLAFSTYLLIRRKRTI